ncbi:unnamed protein product [Nippostrongylus brasiliensis]|uniref:KRAB domain-containing protein n=1 Tax=Nippostrongylus brasiliensis TaxID=27835 RepID=A0A0N4XTI5_NIPBR|nr:unnamed protein product [Nippostrongylus brasiliensis]
MQSDDVDLSFVEVANHYSEKEWNEVLKCRQALHKQTWLDWTVVHRVRVRVGAGCRLTASAPIRCLNKSRR